MEKREGGSYSQLYDITYILLSVKIVVEEQLSAPGKTIPPPESS